MKKILAGLGLLGALHANTFAVGETLEQRIFSALQSKHAFSKLRLDQAANLLYVDERAISLDNIKKEIERRKLSGNAAVDFAVDSIKTILKEINDSDGPKTWLDVKERIFPALAPREYADAAHCSPFSAIVSKCYVIDSPNSRAYVMKDDIARWNVSDAEMQKAAYANLQQITPLDKLDLIKGGLYVASNRRDSYDASRILLPEVQAKIRSIIKGSAFVAIPNREFFIAWGENRPEQDNLVKKIYSDFQKQPHPLTYEIFALDMHGLRIATEKEVAQAFFNKPH